MSNWAGLYIWGPFRDGNFRKKRKKGDSGVLFRFENFFSLKAKEEKTAPKALIGKR